MRQKVKKLVALFMVATLLLSTNISYAKEQQEQTIQEDGMGENNPDITSAVKDSAGEQNAYDNQTEESTTDNKALEDELIDKAPLVQEGNENKIEAALNYIYVGNKVVQTPGEQLIVVSWGSQGEEVDTIKLTWKNDKEEIMEMEGSKENSQLFLFSRTFSAEESGTYEGVSVIIGKDGEEKEFLLEELGIKSCFGVDQDTENLDKSEHIEMEQVVENQENLGQGIVQIEPDSLEEGTEDIGSVLQEAPQTDGSARSRSAMKNSELVIVLDPGHDESKHAGASANNVREEIATLAIAKYCKAALEEYGNVKVYLTRETGTCPFPNSTNNIDDIVKRVNWAKSVNADVFISFHLNSASSTSANGAEVYYPAGNTQGKQLADSIMKELVDIGLYKRGSKADSGYAVITNSIKNGFPGLIIEHAFLSNASDVNDYLSTPSGLKRLGEADAKGIASYYNLSTSNGHWQEQNGNKYYYVNNQMIYGEYYIDGSWYYFDTNTGIMYKGFKSIGSKKVYYDFDGKMVFGETAINGKWYNFSKTDGSMLRGFQEVDGRTVYYNTEGTMLFGSQMINGKEYYFSKTDGGQYVGLKDRETKGKVYYLKEGGLASGEMYLDGHWRYFNPTTKLMVTGIVNLGYKTVAYDSEGAIIFGEKWIDGFWYNFSTEDGSMLKGFQNVEKRKVYYGSDGKMLFGKQIIGGKEYYFSLSDGNQHIGLFTLETKQVIYYLPNGGKGTGEQLVNGKWYYFDVSTYYMYTGLKEFPNKKVYYATSGEMVFGQQRVDGKDYYFSPKDGAMVSGFVEVGGKVMYYFKDGGRASGEVNIEGSWYYFNRTTFERTTGFANLQNKTVYYSAEGKMLFGEQLINGKWYYLSTADGKMQTGFYSFSNKTVYYAATGEMLFGHQVIGGKAYYFDPLSGNLLYNLIVNGIFYGKDGVSQKAETVMGMSTTSPQQMAQFYLAKSGAYPSFYQGSDAPTLLSFCNIIYEEANKQGVRAEVVFTQAMLETGWLRYNGSAVSQGQFNFAGLGAVDGGGAGASFPSVRIGIRAQIQHLQAYASTAGASGLVNSCVDPRYYLVSPKGGAPYIQYLGRQENPSGNYGWASGAQYGIKIVNLMNSMKTY